MSQPNTVREFAGGGTIQELGNGIIRLTTNELTRDHVDAYYQEVATIYNGWRSEAPICVLCDITYGPTTSYFRQRAMELYALGRSLPLQTRQAFVINEENVSDLRKFVNLTGLVKEHKLRIFTNDVDALQWLEVSM
jgi:hypothetical protein